TMHSPYPPSLLLPARPPPPPTLFPYTTLFRSTDALRRMPGWDSPAAAALYHPESRTSVHTSRPPNHLVQSLGREWIPRACSAGADRKSTRLNSSHQIISYAVFCLKKKKINKHR